MTEAVDVDEATVTVELDAGYFPVIDHGESDAPPVVLLHGFPDSRRMWRYQAPALADAGFRVIAPDMRGLGDAPKPDETHEYVLPNAVGDVLGVLDSLDVEEARLVGHDWGSAVAWLLASYHPERVERLVALSVGAPGNSGYNTVEQRKGMWHTYFFQFDAAEDWLRHDDWGFLKDWTGRNGDYERYIEELSRPGALSAALNWYRANAKPRPPGEGIFDYPNVECPAMGVWSDGDHSMTEKQMKRSEEKVDGEWRYEKVEGASHWLALDRPEEVNSLLLDFLGE